MKKTTKRPLYIAAATLCALLASCDDFLDTNPDSRVDLDDAASINKLLVSAYPNADFVLLGESLSDNASDRGVNAILQERWNEQPFMWETVSDIYQGTPTNYWLASYTAIAAANHALEAIEKLEAAGQGDKVRSSRGEALLCRAYAHFMLVNLFAMHYDPATADQLPGVPYATTPEVTLNPTYRRETIAETYRLIEKDLTEGIELIGYSGDQPSWHFTRTAACAFASRYYLWKGGRENWEKSLHYSNQVLGNIGTTDPAQLLRDMNNSESDYNGDYYDAQTLYTSSAEKSNLLLVSCMSMAYYQPFLRYSLGAGIRYQVYDNGLFGYDLCYIIYGSKDYLYHRPLWRYYFRQSGLNAETGYLYANIPLLTCEEVLFNRAEANTLLGNYTDALSDMNSFLSKRIKNWDADKTITSGTVLVCYPASKKEAQPQLNPHFKEVIEANDTCYSYLQANLAMRRAEFLGTGLRWFDIKRYDIPLTHTSETRGSATLPSGDARRACQIPDQATAGGIEPNANTLDIPQSAINDAMTRPDALQNQ